MHFVLARSLEVTCEPILNFPKLFWILSFYNKPELKPDCYLQYGYWYLLALGYSAVSCLNKIEQLHHSVLFLDTSCQGSSKCLRFPDEHHLQQRSKEKVLFTCTRILSQNNHSCDSTSQEWNIHMLFKHRLVQRVVLEGESI